LLLAVVSISGWKTRRPGVWESARSWAVPAAMIEALIWNLSAMGDVMLTLRSVAPPWRDPAAVPSGEVPRSNSSDQAAEPGLNARTFPAPSGIWSARPPF
jgi:hypothetical protein